MRILDRYVFGEWLKIFAMTLAAMVGLLLIGNIYDLMPEFIQWKTPGARVGLFFLMQIPAMMPVIMPVAVLVSLLFVLGHFHKNQEITAMRAAGWSVWRITRSLWVGGLICGGILLAVNTVLAPISTVAARTIRERAELDASRRKKGGAGGVSDKGASVFFENGAERRRWRIDSLGAYTGESRGVQVFELREDGTLARQLLAHTARYDAVAGCWSFADGRLITYDADGREVVTQPAFTRREETGYREKPLHMLLANKRPSDLSITEIETLLALAGDSNPERVAALEVRFHALLASGFACLVVVGLAIPFALSGVRVNPMVGVSKALGLYACYFAIDRIGYAMGSQLILPPVLAAWLPNLVALAVAIRLCRRVN